MSPFHSQAVADRFDAYPPHVRPRMLALRELVLDTAAATPGAGEIEETLKWGEPAYVTRSKAGSTVRMDWKPRHPDICALYFNCRTNLVEGFRQMFPDDFLFEGNRALAFPLDGELPTDAVAFCVAAALTYHIRTREAGTGRTRREG